MRTTLTLDPDVARKVRKFAGDHNTPFKEVVNRALRLGLETLEKKRAPTPFRTEPKPLGLRPGISLDNIADVLDKLDEEPPR